MVVGWYCNLNQGQGTLLNSTWANRHNWFVVKAAGSVPWHCVLGLHWPSPADSTDVLPWKVPGLTQKPPLGERRALSLGERQYYESSQL